jgi:hypothetical protein
MSANVDVEGLDEGEGFADGRQRNLSLDLNGLDLLAVWLFVVVRGKAGIVLGAAVEQRLRDEESHAEEHKGGQGRAHPPNADPPVVISNVASGKAPDDRAGGQEDGVDGLNLSVSKRFLAIPPHSSSKGTYHGPATFVDEVQIPNECRGNRVRRAASSAL